MDFPIYIHFLMAFLGTLGFCLLFHVPYRHILLSATGGGLGWVTYMYVVSNGNSAVAASFLGACTVSLVAEFSSRAGKEATTLFIIPGIIPLVPGAPLYYTMRAILENQFDTAAELGAQALFMAGSMAIALLLITSFTRFLVALKNSLSS